VCPPGGKDDPSAADYRKLNAVALKNLTTAITTLKKNYPDAKATKEALTLAETLQLKIN
jgi:hypothetical protein